MNGPIIHVRTHRTYSFELTEEQLELVILGLEVHYDRFGNVDKRAAPLITAFKSNRVDAAEKKA